MNSINKLVSDSSNNNAKWDKIYNMFKKNKIDPKQVISNYNNILHLAAVNNNYEVLSYALKQNPKSLNTGDKDGNTPFHLLALYGYYDTLTKLLKNPKSKETASLLNDSNQNLLHLTYDNNKLFKWLINNTNININKTDEHDNTPLLLNINKTDSIKDTYFDNIVELLKHMVDINKNTQIPALNYAVSSDKNHVVKYFLKLKESGNNINVDIKDTNHLTPLNIAFGNNNSKLAKLLIKNGADVNYSGPEGDNNAMMRIIIQGDDDMVNYLMDNGYDMKSHNRDINTALHFAYSKGKLSTTTLFRLTYHGNLNTRNIHGTTPLHLLLKYHDWKHYTSVLKDKKLDLYSENSIKKVPFDYVKDNDISEFLDFLSENYGKQINEKISSLCCKKNKCTRKEILSSKCQNIIKNHILKTQRSMPSEEDKSKFKKFKFIEGIKTEKGTFNSDSMHNIIYTIIFLEKNKNLSIPHRYYIHDKVMTEKISQSINLYHNKYGNVITDVVRGYSDFMYEISPYLIMWRNEDLYYMDKDLDFYLLKSLNNKKIRFVLFKLTLVASTQGTHANIILFDKKTGMMDRFDPYGGIPYLDSGRMDEIFEKKFKKMLGWYLKKNNLKFKYISPKDFVGFQIISDDSNKRVKKLGDPFGYCLAWTYWYIEMRINNPSMHPKDLIQQSLGKLIEKRNKDRGNNIFIDFIRDYSGKLDKMKNNFLLKAGINKDRFYNLSFNKDEDELISKHAIKIFNKITE